MHLLGVSTSTGRASLALLSRDRLVCERASLDQRSHAARLFEGVEALLASAGLAPSALELVAVDVGPGSFTGIRVGVASAIGLALALGVRAVGVSSLEALCAAELERGEPAGARHVISVLDAKKGELFVQSFVEGAPQAEPRAVARGELGAFVREAEAHAGLVATLVGELEADDLLFDEGQLGVRLARLVRSSLPDAAVVARVAHARLEAGLAREPSPLYVRPPDITRPAPHLATER
jgi:tRNA threonylcarbamoyladenosine biosynthesis protein TsaB